MEEFIRVVLLFFIYSFIGWLWETVYCSLKAKKFVYRGFLIGPYCPIYGFGILSVLYFVEPFQKNIVILYVFSTVIVTALEYVTSYGLEKLFHASWWDYKDVPFNINGRVALPVSLFWGIACVLIVRVVQPEVQKVETFLSNQFGIILPILLLVLMGADLVYTLINMQAFKKITNEISVAVEDSKAEWTETIDSKKEQLSTNLSQIKQTVSEELEKQKQERLEKAAAKLEALKNNSTLTKLSGRFNFQQRRLINNYPKLTFKGIKNPEEVRHVVKENKKNRK